MTELEEEHIPSRYGRKYETIQYGKVLFNTLNASNDNVFMTLKPESVELHLIGIMFNSFSTGNKNKNVKLIRTSICTYYQGTISS